MTSITPMALTQVGPALALQGGGVHGAFAWGAVDRLLEDGVRPSRISGVSSGALLGTMLVQGMVKGGIPGARQEMRALWNRVAQAHTLAPLRGGAMDQWFWGGEAGSNLAWEGIETALRMFSPAQLNPFDHNPLRAIIADLIDRRALADAAAIPLVVSATDVQTGAPSTSCSRRVASHSCSSRSVSTDARSGTAPIRAIRRSAPCWSRARRRPG
jgi:NTE family protein